MEQICYGITIVIYGIFIIRFILSWVGGDFDLDADSDLDLGDVVSFKGATHFLMGLFGWLSTKYLIVHKVMWYDYLIGFFIGLIFVVILFYVYKLMLSLESKPNVLSGQDLVGKTGTIYINLKNKKYLVTVANGVGTTEVLCESLKEYKIGDKVVLSNYNGAFYSIN